MGDRVKGGSPDGPNEDNQGYLLGAFRQRDKEKRHRPELWGSRTTAHVCDGAPTYCHRRYTDGSETDAEKPTECPGAKSMGSVRTGPVGNSDSPLTSPAGYTVWGIKGPEIAAGSPSIGRASSSVWSGFTHCARSNGEIGGDQRSTSSADGATHAATSGTLNDDEDDASGDR